MRHEVSLRLTRAKENLTPVNEKETEYEKEWKKQLSKYKIRS